MVILSLAAWLGLAAVGLGGPQQPDGGVMPDGLKALKHPNVQVRYNGVELLGRLGKTARFAVPELKTLLKDDPSIAVRLKAAESLWKIEQTDPALLMPVLLEATAHKEDVVRSAGLEVITQLGEKAKAALPAVKKGLQDKAFTVRYQAVLATGAMASIAKPAVPELLNVIREDEVGLLEAQATVALGKIGTGAVPALSKALADKSDKLRRAAAFALGLIGPKAYAAVPELTTALKDSEPLIRALAAEALGKVGTESEPALPELKKALTDKDVNVCVNAALALWRIGKDASGLDELSAALTKSSDVQLRRSAAMALAEFGAAAKSALVPLTAALAEPDEELRRECVVALGRIGADAAPATKLLQPLLTDKSFPVRLQAVLALWRIEKQLPAESIKVLEQGLLQEQPALVLRTIGAAQEMGPAARAFAPALAEALLHRDPEVRAEAAAALKKIDPKAATQKGVK
jgi:HEAT repeat protein